MEVQSRAKNLETVPESKVVLYWDQENEILITGLGITSKNTGKEMGFVAESRLGNGIIWAQTWAVKWDFLFIPPPTSGLGSYRFTIYGRQLKILCSTSFSWSDFNFCSPFPFRTYSHNYYFNCLWSGDRPKYDWVWRGREWGTATKVNFILIALIFFPEKS